MPKKTTIIVSAPKAKTKNKTSTMAEKRKAAAKVPGAKSARGKEITKKTKKK